MKKEDFFKIYFISDNNSEDDNSEPFIYDDRGFRYSKSREMFDPKGESFDPIYQRDSNGGRYDRYGVYIPGPGYIKKYGLYSTQVANSNKSEEELEKEKNIRNEFEFQKIKDDGIISKK